MKDKQWKTQEQYMEMYKEHHEVTDDTVGVINDVKKALQLWVSEVRVGSLLLFPELFVEVAALVLDQQMWTWLIKTAVLSLPPKYHPVAIFGNRVRDDPLRVENWSKNTAVSQHLVDIIEYTYNEAAMLMEAIDPDGFDAACVYVQTVMDKIRLRPYMPEDVTDSLFGANSAVSMMREKVNRMLPKHQTLVGIPATELRLLKQVMQAAEAADSAVRAPSSSGAAPDDHAPVMPEENSRTTQAAEVEDVVESDDDDERPVQEPRTVFTKETSDKFAGVLMSKPTEDLISDMQEVTEAAA